MEVTAKYCHGNFNANMESIQKISVQIVHRDKKAAAVFSICIERKSEVRNRDFTRAIK